MTNERDVVYDTVTSYWAVYTPNNDLLYRMPGRFADTPQQVLLISEWADKIKDEAYMRGVRAGYAKAQQSFRALIGIKETQEVQK